MTEKLPQPPNSAVSDAPTELALDLPPDSLTGRASSSTVSSSADMASVRVAAVAEAKDTVRLRMATLTEEASGLAHGHRDVASYVGLIIDGRYQIESAIAQGGMGMVYKARHRLLDKLVAVKVLRPELVHNDDITRRFLTEAQAASAIGSPHIVDVTDFGELPDGATYIVMEYLDGEPLSALLKSVGRLAPLDVVEIARQLTEGLEQAHLGQIVHRDLKPDNVLLIQLGKQTRFAKILDFGIAKVASSQNETTRAGKIFGTPHYMSPEQARGESLDGRTDIYSLGVMLFEMLTGQLPFAAENPLGVLTQHMYVEAPLLSEHLDPTLIDVNWEAVVAKCLAKERTQRYASMAELEADLARLGRGEPTAALSHLRSLPTLSPKLRQRLGGGSTRKPTRRAVTWTVALLTVTGIAAFGTQRYPEWLGFTSGSEVPGSSSSLAGGALDALATIDVVLSPIDAHVFQGTHDLGPMPIQLRLRRGQRTELSVRRRGYKTQWIVVDGSQPRIQIELRPVPGARSVAAPTPSLALGATRTVILSDPIFAANDGGEASERDAGALTPDGQDVSSDLPKAEASEFYGTPLPPGPPPRDTEPPPKLAATTPAHLTDGLVAPGPPAAEPAPLPPGPSPASSPSPSD